MAHILDTVSIRPDTVTLSGYNEIWSVADKHRNPIKDLPDKLDAMAKAAENFTWVAEDLPNLPDGQTRTSLLRLLIYYLRGLRYAVFTASSRGNQTRITRKRDGLDTLLNDLERGIRRVDSGLAALPSGSGNFDIPNRSILELLVHAYYERLPQNNRPTTLVEFKTMINQLILPQNARARSPHEKDDATGLPSVLFCCLSHVDPGGNRILVASCSTDLWGTFFKRTLHIWRTGRFDTGPNRDRLAAAGDEASRKFEFILAKVKGSRLGMEIRHEQNTLTDEDYNAIGRAMFEDDGVMSEGDVVHPALPTNFGFNHLAEVGRAFSASGKDMFSEISRCWKCRFIHHYNVNAGLAGPISQGAPVVLPENPRLTKLHANGPLGCAEDLVHFQCSRLPAVQPAVPMPAVPPPTYPTGLTPTSHYLENAHEAHSHLELCVAELCAFYRSLSFQQVSFIGHPVEPGSIVAGLLANLENSVLPERLAALIYLCATFNDLGYSPSCMQYIGRLEEKLASQALRLEASLVGLVWSLIADFDNLILECPERTWLLSRLMYVAARLSADLRRKLGNQLLRFPTGDRRDNLLLDLEDVEAEIWRDIALVKVKEDRARTAT